MHPDSPIEATSEDLLSRTDFAIGVADSIAGYQPTDSLAIGIVGPWGCGKSSLINLITRHLEDRGDSKPLIVRFNPWRYSGSDQLFANFFTTLAKTIGASEKIKILKNAAGKMNQTANALALLKPVPYAGPFLNNIAELLKTGASNVNELVADAGSLDALHNDLTKELLNAHSRILIIIDDIDRLSPAEILQTFQLVKSLANFPYVMYILAYDENVVLRAIDNNETVARKYLEKIVNLSIDVPPAHRAVIDDLVISSLFELIKSDMPTYVDDERLVTAYINGYRAYFQTLRDVRRFLNLFAFNYGRLSKIVDIGDLTAITALEVFENRLFKTLSLSASTVIETVDAVWRGDHKYPKETRKRIENLIDQCGCSDPTAATETLRQIFPKVDSSIREYAYNFSSIAEKADARIASPDYFHLFFNMGVAPNEITDSEYAAVLTRATAAGSDSIDLLKDLGTDKVISFIRRLHDDSAIPNLPKEQAILLVQDLFRIEQRFTQQIPVGLMSFPFSWNIEHAVLHIFSKSTSANSYDALLKVVEGLDIGIGSAMVVIEKIDRLKEKSNFNVFHLSDAHILSLKTAAVGVLDRAIDENRLVNENNVSAIMLILSIWKASATVERIVAAIRSTPDMLIAYVDSLQERRGFQGILKPKPMPFSLQHVKPYIPLIEVIARVAALDESLFGNQNQRWLIANFLHYVNNNPNLADEAADLLA